MHLGARVLEVIRRGSVFAIRVRDPQAATLTGFTGVPTFDPDVRWVVEGRFYPYPAVEVVTVGSVVAGLTHQFSARGVIHCVIGGEDHTLTAFARKDGSLAVLFRDGTSGRTTAPSARSLLVEAPDLSGRVVLDFNRSTNLPCAFTEYATCPVPPPENILSVAVEAGEKLVRH